MAIYLARLSWPSANNYEMNLRDQSRGGNRLEAVEEFEDSPAAISIGDDTPLDSITPIFVPGPTAPALSNTGGSSDTLPPYAWTVPNGDLRDDWNDLFGSSGPLRRDVAYSEFQIKLYIPSTVIPKTPTASVSSGQFQVVGIAIPHASSYKFRLRRTEVDSAWTEASGTSSSHTFSDLSNGLEYEAQIQALFRGNTTSLWSASVTNEVGSGPGIFADTTVITENARQVPNTRIGQIDYSQKDGNALTVGKYRANYDLLYDIPTAEAKAVHDRLQALHGTAVVWQLSYGLPGIKGFIRQFDIVLYRSFSRLRLQIEGLE